VNGQRDTCLGLLQTVDSSMEIKVDLTAVRDKDTFADVLQSLLLKLGEFLEETRGVENNP